MVDCDDYEGLGTWNMTRTIRLENFDDLDLSDYTMPLFTVYYNPDDFPGRFVVRLWDMEQSTPFAILGESLEDVRSKLPHGLHRLPRNTNDAPAIIETWL